MMALGAEIGAIIALIGDTQASTQIPLRLLLPIVQLNLIYVAFKVFAEWLPAALTTHAMATSTEMMKDRSCIEAVIQRQKTDKNDRNYRVFQAMRLMRREYMKMLLVDNLSEDGSSEYGEETRTVVSNYESAISELSAMPVNNKRLKEVTVKHIMENFQKLGRPGDRSTYLRRSTQSDEDTDSMRSMTHRYGSPDEANWVVGVDKIHHLISMCGGDLKKFESFYLLRRSNYVSAPFAPFLMSF